MTRMKIRGDRGQPWRIPWEAGKKFVGVPLINTAKVVEDRQPKIQLTVWRGAPIWINMRWIKVQLTRSKALIKSSLRMKAQRFLDLIEWSDSWTIPMGSTIWRFLRNPYCSWEMPESKKGLILTAITLEISLYRRLHKEMGLKSAKVCGLSLLGIRSMKVVLREVGIKPKILVLSTAERSSFPNS